MKNLLFTLIFIIASFGARSQNITFQKAYSSGNASVFASDVLPVSDGYIVSGSRDTTSANGAAVDRVFLMKIDHDGNVVWLRYYGLGFQVSISKIIEANDGGFVAIGSVAGFNTQWDPQMFLIKTDKDGMLQWQKLIPSYQTNRRNNGYWIQSISDGYILSGRSTKGDVHAVLMRIDNLGNTVWSKRYYYDWGDNPIFVEFYIGGDTIYAVGSKDTASTLSLLHVATGDPISIVRFDSPAFTKGVFNSLAPAQNGDWILLGVGHLPAGGTAPWVCRVSRTGNLRWSRSYSNIGQGSIKPLSDGNFLLITSGTVSGNQKSDPILTKIDGNGEMLWSHKYGLPTQDQFYTASATLDSGIIAVGSVRHSDQSSKADILIVKTDENGWIADCCSLFVYSVVDTIPAGVAPEFNINQSAFDNAIHQHLPSENADLDMLDYCPSIMDSIQVPLCTGDSITLNGVTYTQPGTYTQILPGSSNRCDTLATYILAYAPQTGPTTVSLQCPVDTTVFISQHTDTTKVDYLLPFAMSDCICPEIALSRTAGNESGAYFPVGLHTICYQADDACGMSQSCCFNIRVEPEVIDEACDSKQAGCIRFEVLEVTRNTDGHWVYYTRVTNACAEAVKFVYFQLPAGLVAVAPVNQSGYTSPQGNPYVVRNPNFSPFYAIRFKPAGAALSPGHSDIFRYTLPEQASVSYIHAAARLISGAYFETHLNTFSCPVGTEQSRSDQISNRSTGTAAAVESWRIYPNPVHRETTLTIQAHDTEGCFFQLHDMTGRMLLSAPVWNRQVDLGDAGWTNGVYLFRIHKEGEVLGSGKLVVLR